MKAINVTTKHVWYIYSTLCCIFIKGQHVSDEEGLDFNERWNILIYQSDIY